jgi:hypothetical protein
LEESKNANHNHHHDEEVLVLKFWNVLQQWWHGPHGNSTNNFILWTTTTLKALKGVTLHSNLALWQIWSLAKERPNFAWLVARKVKSKTKYNFHVFFLNEENGGDHEQIDNPNILFFF